MNYMAINTCDTANGEGARVSLFVSGCSFACKGCHNHGAWPYKAGKLFDTEAFNKITKALEEPHIAGLSILGGEPLEPRNIQMVNLLVNYIKWEYSEDAERFKDKT
ncbi:MAG: 4Fe-4S cluster-binding domain-containing protein, partial [Plesiomonas shigelloides]